MTLTCGECPNGHNVCTGSTIWVKCKHQHGMRSVGAVCNIDRESLPRKEMKK